MRLILRDMSPQYTRTIGSIASLAGVIGFACMSLPALAGENIIFSAPPKTLALPNVERIEKENSADLPSPLTKFSGPEVDPGISFGPSMTVILTAPRNRNSRISDRKAGPERNFETSLAGDENPEGRFDPGAGYDDAGYDKMNGLDDPRESRERSSAQSSFVSVTNGWDIGKSWNSMSWKDSMRMGRSGDEKERDRALPGSELGAWRVRTGSEDQKDDETSAWQHDGRGDAHRSRWMGAFGSRTSFWDKSRLGETDRSKADENKSLFPWHDSTTPAEPTLFGSQDWFQRDTATGFNATAAAAAETPLQAWQIGAPKADDQMAGLLKDSTDFLMPGAATPAFSDPLPRLDLISQFPAQTPMAPAVLAFPKRPGDLFH